MKGIRETLDSLNNNPVYVKELHRHKDSFFLKFYYMIPLIWVVVSIFFILSGKKPPIQTWGWGYMPEHVPSGFGFAFGYFIFYVTLRAILETRRLFSYEGDEKIRYSINKTEVSPDTVLTGTFWYVFLPILKETVIFSLLFLLFTTFELNDAFFYVIVITKSLSIICFGVCVTILSIYFSYNSKTSFQVFLKTLFISGILIIVQYLLWGMIITMLLNDLTDALGMKSIFLRNCYWNIHQLSYFSWVFYLLAAKYYYNLLREKLYMVSTV